MSRLYQFISTAGICAVSGTIAGAFVGGLFGLVQFVAANPPMPPSVLIGIAIGLSLVAWIVVLVIVGVFGNYGAIAIARQSFVTSSITGILTVFFVHATRSGLFGMLLGWIIGFLVGKALCAWCSASQRRRA
jgi:hypothetical protein